MTRNLPGTDWRNSAACLGHPNPQWWDDNLDGARETAPQRAARHASAAIVCRGCPVHNQCLADVEPFRDEGVRAAVVLPSLDRPRTSPGAGRPPEPIEHGTAAGYRKHLRRCQPVPPTDPCGCRAGMTADRRRARDAS